MGRYQLWRLPIPMIIPHDPYAIVIAAGSINVAFNNVLRPIIAVFDVCNLVTASVVTQCIREIIPLLDTKSQFAKEFCLSGTLRMLGVQEVLNNLGALYSQ